MWRWLAILAVCFSATLAVAADRRPPGRFVDLGGWSQYIYCTGRGGPTIVIEPGLGDFGSDWIRVQERVRRHARICTYDRAGYGFSDPGPMPRTYAQINTDLHRLLHAAGERGPFILVGHSFGGPLVRNYARMFPNEIAGLVMLEAASEDQQVYYGGAYHRIRDNAQPGRVAPEPQTRMDAPRSHHVVETGDVSSVDSAYQLLTEQERGWRAWAQARPSLREAQNSETTWSPDYLQDMYANPTAWTLGDLPLLVVTRREGGYEDRPGAPAAQMEAERLAQQNALAALSTRSQHVVADIDHNPNLTDPAQTARWLVDFQRQVSGMRRR